MTSLLTNLWRWAACALVCLPCLDVAAEASTSSASRTVFAASIKAPEGFASLEEPRQLLADVYFGGMKVAEAQVVVEPGVLRFMEPGKLLESLPKFENPESIHVALQGKLPSNSDRVCSTLNVENCGSLAPEQVGIIFDEDRFRVDIFIHSRFLKDIDPVETGYLPAPSNSPSMTSSMGLSLSGTSYGAHSYNLQNRSIIALGEARLRTNSSYSSGLGLVTDDLVVELDRRNSRYSAGMFWAPGNDMIGQRRIIGAGFSTQLDTRIDKDLLEGTPILLFLERAARVEVFADGRLLDSRVYEAGNNRIDTTSLPSGAYSLLLRVHQADGKVREEQRFFARNAQIAPVGKPLYFAFAGVLASTRRNRPLSHSSTLFYQVGTAHRLSSSIALDASLIGTQHKNMFGIGGNFLSSKARFRAALLMSMQGDKGALLQGGTSSTGPLSIHFDLRTIRSSDGRPLIPHSIHGETFDFKGPRPAQLGAGSYTQGSGSFTYRFGSGFVGVAGSYRRDKGYRSDYTIGPTLSYPVLHNHGLQLLVQADAQRSRHSNAAYVGLRLLKVSNGRALVSSAGFASHRELGARAKRSTRSIGSIAGEWYHQASDSTEWSVGAAAERTIQDTSVRTHGSLFSELGRVRGDLLHRFRNQASTQYGLSVQTGVATDSRSVAIGGRDLTHSALLVHVDGDAADVEFDILVDDVSRGRVSAGGKRSIFLPPYRSYRVRLKPTQAVAISFDSQAKHFALYPGSVQTLRWTTKSLMTLFGQAVAADGGPLANARVETEDGLGQTDDQGYFQVDMAVGDELRLTHASDTICRVNPQIAQQERGYASLGKVICK